MRVRRTGPCARSGGGTRVPHVGPPPRAALLLHDAAAAPRRDAALLPPPRRVPGHRAPDEEGRAVAATQGRGVPPRLRIHVGHHFGDVLRAVHQGGHGSAHEGGSIGDAGACLQRRQTSYSPNQLKGCVTYSISV
jgi:hypothetical protein